MTNTEILIRTLNKMPRTFSSNRFAIQAKKYGLDGYEVTNGNMCLFLHANADRGNSKRMWNKRQVTEVSVKHEPIIVPHTIKKQVAERLIEKEEVSFFFGLYTKSKTITSNN